MKTVLFTTLTVLLFAVTAQADSEDWKVYLRSSNSVASYSSLTKPDKNTREVISSVQYGGACVYNRYRFDCKNKKWLQIEVAALPCGMPFKMAPGDASNEWANLNYKNTSKEIKKTA